MDMAFFPQVPLALKCDNLKMFAKSFTATTL